MDTRTKIIAPEAASEVAERLRAGGKKILVVAGAFDVLQAEHARALRALLSPGIVIFAAVTDSCRPVLALRARAEMVAALESVSHVIPLGEGLEELLEKLRPDQVHYEEAEDERRLRALIQHVRQRHSG